VAEDEKVRVVNGGVMKKIALPKLGKRIAPRLGITQEFMIAIVAHGEIEQRTILDLSGFPPLLKMRRLREEGVNVLICSGIERVRHTGHPRYNGAD